MSCTKYLLDNGTLSLYNKYRWDKIPNKSIFIPNKTQFWVTNFYISLFHGKEESIWTSFL